MQYWLVKSDPDEYGWKEFVRDGSTQWTGVRNHAAKGFLQKMKKGDIVLFYESQGPRCIVGEAEVVIEAYLDPTRETDEYPWVAVTLKPLQVWKTHVTLEQIKKERVFDDFALVRQSRLSVMPVSVKQYKTLQKMAKL